ncbi:crotonobetaine/carnitine-CoA ligase [Desulfobotulus sp. H1]|uniref:Crotonobetaine/carnitine-CoA ligase n=1 Tax=Desulfobotulus pelophilus TaxID=2823377 RepID=A0ABT3NAT5_9BACT|nr:crotonobetaine/carnitine-CoA ligase [Desulfobotulus pelophilus]
MDIVGEKSLGCFWEKLALLYGSRTALVFEDSSGRTCEYSYADLNAEICRAANLFHGLGIESGDRVLLQLHNSPEFLIAWFGLSFLGAVSVPLNVHYQESECAYILEKCRPKAIVVEESFLHLHGRKCSDNERSVEIVLIARLDGDTEHAGCLNFNTLLKNQSSGLAEKFLVSPDAPAEILFTSGTTSKPKGVVITHHNLLFAGRYTAWQCCMRSEDRYLTMMPAWHIDFQCTAAMPTFASGATFIMLESYSARKFWQQVCIHRATITECIPLMVRTLMLQPQRSWEKDHCLREVFFYLTLTEQEKEAFVERFHVRFLTSYGMTESIVGVIGDCPGDERRWPSMGRPGFGYEVKVIGCDGMEVSPGCVGEICIKGVPGRTLFKEYYMDHDATAKALDAEGWLRTGDRGYMDGDGYFYFVDRQINVIKRSGENISSTEIECFLQDHPKVMEAAVIGVPDTICDESIKAFVIPKEGEQVSEKELLEYCSMHIAKFKLPGSVEIRESFPRTCTGKVRKNLLREETLGLSGKSSSVECGLA